jgi:NAD(P)-dependent dehydrogenase (short-subunit alcohol dehydrogenase family)
MVGALRVLITGGNAGVGFEAARQLLKLGHHAIIACRDADKAKKAVDALT